MVTANPDIPNIPKTPDLDVRLSFGPARPVVLFPVRLETRFFQQPDGTTDLCVRVYPDKVHIDSHEPKLTDDELTWGKHFWEQLALAGANVDQQKAAWRQLADRYDPPRAAWVAHATRKLAATATVETKTESWTRAPLARVLPNQWLVLGYKDGRLMINVKGQPISDDLNAGPDPSASAKLDKNGLDTGMRWMIDFATAEKVGMGIRVKMNRDAANAGLDFLLVLGVKDSLNAKKDWTPQLKDVFEAHHYTSGLSFIPAGTPSNNTTDAPSGFSSKDPVLEDSYLAELTSPSTKPGEQTNAFALVNALGLSKFAQTFANLPHATEKDQLDAQHMNNALWAATWGYFLLQMLGVDKPNESPLKDDDIAWARDHFIHFVRANGPLPAIRVGRQPYGILPVTSLSTWKPSTGQETQFRRDLALRDFLLKLRDLWRRNYFKVPRLGRSPDTPQESGIERDLPEVLSMDGLSSSYSMRHLMGRQYLEHLWVFLSAEFFLDVWNLEIPEIPQPEEPPEIEEPDPDLPPRLRAQFRQQQIAARNAFIRREAQRVAAATAARARIVERINSKRRASTAWWETQERLATTALQKLGVPWRPRMSKAVFSTPVSDLKGPLVQADKAAPSPQRYIDSLLAQRDLLKELWFQGPKFEQPPPHTLLHLLLRHSMLNEYSDAARRLLVKKFPQRQDPRREPELVNLKQGEVTQTIWDQMKTRITLPNTQTTTLGKYLFGSNGVGDPDVTRDPELKSLQEFRASLTHLKSPELGVARLEQLMAGTLDLCSHRLDAWITSFATKRLADMRKADPDGVLFGGYGWVMNLEPGETLTPVATPPGEEGQVFQLPGNPGFIHTPSLAQATTVAILRSGHLAHAGAVAENDLLAIDLSSERVRLASWLLDGVRAGQPLGALLGYRFERRLQEVGKAQFIAPFRELAPLVAKKLEQTNQPVEAIAANNVVDGLAVMRRWQKGKSTAPELWDATTIPFGQKIGQQRIPFPPANQTNPEFNALKNELNLLEEAVDSVSDALIAESIHQVVRGNPLRAATTVESIAGGETPPPELDVVRTPRSGIALTHRVVTLFSGDPQVPSQWNVSSTRAAAEPHLNAWVARMLVNPANVRCLVERLDPETAQVVEPAKEIRLSKLGLAPIDYIYAAEAAAGQQGELEQRILFAIMRATGGFAPGSLLRVSLQRKPDWPISDLSYGQFSELLRAVRKLINGVRALDGHDLISPDQVTDFDVDAVELNKRADSAVASLQETVRALSETADLETLRQTLLRAASFGVPGAIPLSATGNSASDRETLVAQASAIQKELAPRVAQLAGRDAALDRLHIVFGKTFLVLPRFTPANAGELEKALANSDNVQGGDALVSLTWLRQVARVRETVSRFQTALNYSEALKTGEKLKLKIAQLPQVDNERWVALPLEPGKSLPGGKLSIAVQSSVALDMHQPLAGLLIDEWVEVVPGGKEITGIALQYDQPGAAPPQSILVAVPPEPDVPWTIWSLQQVLLETLDLARIRAVDPAAFDEVGHYLPALYFAFNTLGDTVSTDFGTIKQ